MISSEDTVSSKSKAIARWRYILGLVCCVMVTILWVGSSFLIQGLFDEGWEQPIVISYCSTSVFAIYLPFFYLLKYFRNKSKNTKKDGAQYQTLDEVQADGSILIDNSHDDAHITLPTTKTIYVSPPVKSFTQHLQMALYFAPLWFVMNMAFNWALTATTITSTTVLSSTSGLFVVLFSVLMLNKPFLPLHAVGALFTLLGAALISFLNRPEDDDASKHSLRGDMIAVLSAVLYAIYSVSLEKWSGDSTPVAVTVDLHTGHPVYSTDSAASHTTANDDVSHLRSPSHSSVPLVERPLQHTNTNTVPSALPLSPFAIADNVDTASPYGVLPHSYTPPGAQLGVNTSPLSTHAQEDSSYRPHSPVIPDDLSHTAMASASPQPPCGALHAQHDPCAQCVAYTESLPLTAPRAAAEITLPDLHPPTLAPVLDMVLLFGCIGVVNMVILWPVMLFIHYTGIERITPPPAHLIPMLLLNAFVGTGLSDFLWANSVVLTSPLIATLSLSATIPLAMLVDVLFKDRSFNGGFVFGSALVAAGFIMANVGAENKAGKEQKEAKEDIE